jgi:hypothetical protein
VEVALAEDDDVSEAFSTDRAHEAFGIWVLPGGTRRGASGPRCLA